MKFFNILFLLCVFLTISFAYEIPTSKVNMISSKLTGVEYISAQPIYSVATPTETTHYYYITTKSNIPLEHILSIAPQGFTLKGSGIYAVKTTTYNKNESYVEERQVNKTREEIETIYEEKIIEHADPYVQTIWEEKKILHEEEDYSWEETVLEEKNISKIRYWNETVFEQKNITKTIEYTETEYVNKSRIVPTTVYTPTGSKSDKVKEDGGKYLLEVKTSFGAQGKFNPDVSACAELNETNGQYNLTQNISINGSTCFSVTAANVTLDCKGFSITGNNSTSTYGVYSNQANTTVRNCNISNFVAGIYTTGTNSLFELNTVSASGTNLGAITTVSGGNHTIRNNTLTAFGLGGGSDALYIQNPSYPVIAEYNYVYSNGTSARGIFSSSTVSGTTIRWNTVNTSTTLGILVTSNTNVSGNIINGQVGATYGIGSANVNNLLHNNTIYGASNGYYVYSSGVNTTIDCAGKATIGTNASYGVNSNQLNTTIRNCNISKFKNAIYSTGSNGLIENNTLDSTYGESYSLSNSVAYFASNSGNKIINNNITAKVSPGIGLSGGNTQNISNNTIVVTNGQYAIEYSSGSNMNTISNNDITGAIYAYAGNSTNISNNIFRKTSGTSYAIRWQFSTTTNNTVFNNTILNVTKAFYIDSAVGGNRLYANNITATTWVDDSNGTNFYNSTGIGNIYYFANGTPSWSVYNITSSTAPNWADGGSQRPFNGLLTQWTGAGNDWFPYTENLGTAITPTPCKTLSTANEVYSLTSNLYSYGSTCFNVTAPNVVLDCNGFSITGSNSDIGIFSNQLNTTVRNCIIQNFSQGIFTNTAPDSLFLNNTISSVTPMQIRGHNSQITNNTITQTATSAYGIVTDGGSSSGSNTTIDCGGRSILGNNASGTYGVYSSQANTTIRNCNISNFATGIDLASDSTDYARITNNTINITYRTSCSQSTGVCSGIFVYQADYATITDNTISVYDGAIVLYSNAYFANVKRNRINAINSYALYGLGTQANNYEDNNITSASYSILDYSVQTHNYTNNTVTSISGAYAARGSTSVRLINNSFTTVYQPTYFYSDANTRYTILNNTFYSSSVSAPSGLYFDAAAHTNFTIANNNISGFASNAYNYGIFMATNSSNISYMTVENNTIIARATGVQTLHPIYLGNGYSNTFRNNTIISNASTVAAIKLEYRASRNKFYENNITGTLWIINNNETNQFNTTGIGNIYYFANGTPSWQVYAIYTNDSDNWADYGENRPFNASLAQWTGLGEDWHPYTLNTNHSIRITQNVSFTNATVGHWFYANATAYNPAGYNQSSNISASSGSCSLVSSTETNWTLAVVYNCTAQTPSTSIINITFFDVYQVTNSTQANNSYPDPNNATLTAPNITGTASVGNTLTCNAGNFSDADGDIENISARTWRWFNGTAVIAGANNTTLALTLGYNGAVIKCEESVVAQNWTTSRTANNSSAVNISNANPVNATLENMINATTSHQFNITAYADDADGGQDITVWNLTSTHGTCTFLSNSTSGNRRTVLINCYAQSEGTTQLNVTFADFNGLYNWTAQNFTYIDHEANLSAPYITPISNNTAENLTCNLGNWSDIDGDLENATARSFRWFVNGVNINVSDQTLAYGNFTNGNSVICEQFAIAQNWTTSNATTNSSAVFISNQSVNLVIVSPTNGSLINSCNFTVTIFVGFQNGTTNRTATCSLYYNGQFIDILTQNVSNGFYNLAFANLTNNGNYSVTCQAQDSLSTSIQTSAYTTYYQMTACYAQVYGTVSTFKNTTAVYTEVTIENFDVRSILGIMIIGLAMFGLVSYTDRLSKLSLFKRLWR